MVTLLRPPSAPAPTLEPDADHAAVLAHRGPVLRVVGGPGTGKSTLAVELVADRVERDGLRPDQCLVLAPTRRAAARLRDAVTARVAGTASEPLARTPHSFAFGVLRRWAAEQGLEPPRLITGPEQDVILRELLEGYAGGSATAPAWPAALAEAVGTRTFRGELRDLLMRCAELGLGPEDLRELARAHDRPEWSAAATVLAEYDGVTALASPGSLDPASLVGVATNHLLRDPGLAGVRRELRLVVVDDAQELTPASAALVDALTAGGPDLVLLGDPDAAAQTFRGAEPALMHDGWPAAPVLVLGQGHRLPAGLQAAAARVTPYIGSVGGAAHRRPRPLPRPATGAGAGGLSVRVFRTPAQEAAWVAERLRRAHLLDGLPWAQMAVIARSGGAMRTVERVLRSSGVPVGGTPTRPLRDHPAVRPLLMVTEAVLGPDDPAAPIVDPDTAVDLLLSPLGGADAVTLRRTRRALRRRELATGGGRPSGELLAEAVGDPMAAVGLGPELAAVQRVARVVEAARAAATAPAATIETILWAMWSASGLGGVWQRAALAGGPGGRRADEHLDAVVTLFDTAARYVDRLPGAAPQEFVHHLAGQELAADTLAAHAPDEASVALLTPADAAGREWSLVCVVGVQEGAWPDPRLRGVLLGSSDLVDAARGRLADRRAARTAVLHDETRLLLVAVTRAFDEVNVSGVRSEEEQPSVYLDVLDPRAAADGARPMTDPPRPLSLPGLVAELRRGLVEGDPGDRAAAVMALRRLIDRGVPGADPSSWWPLLDVSDTRPRRAPDQSVRVSPSRLDRFGKCQLQWLLSSCGGQGPSQGASDIGTLVHALAHELGDTTADAYAAALRERWGTLGLPPGWLSDRSLAQAVAMTDRLAAYPGSTAAAGWTKVASEAAVDVTIGRARIRGQVDRVEQDDAGRLRIIDLKTGSTKPTGDEILRHRQLGAYQLAVSHGGLGEAVVSGGAALLQLGKAAAASRTTLQTQVALAEDADPGWAEEQVRADAEAMAGAVFAATPSRGLCGTCAVRSSCPARAEGRQLT